VPVTTLLLGDFSDVACAALTCSVIQRPARSVIGCPSRNSPNSLRWLLDRACSETPKYAVINRRRAAIRKSCSVQNPWERVGSGQRKRRLCQTRRVGRLKDGRSTNSTRRDANPSRGRLLRTADTIALGEPFNVHARQVGVLFLDPEGPDGGKARQKSDHAKRVGSNGNSPVLLTLDTSILAELSIHFGNDLSSSSVALWPSSRP